MKILYTFLLYFASLSIVFAQNTGNKNEIGLATKSINSPNYLCHISINKHHLLTSSRQALTGVDIDVYNLTTQKEILKLKKHPQNKFSVNFKHGNEYIIMLRKEGFLIKRVHAKIGMDGCIACVEGLNMLTPFGAQEINSIANLNMMLRPTNIGDRIVISDIKFEGKSTDLTANTMRALDELARVLRDNSSILGELELHTDARGSAEDNLILSNDRGEVIAEYLMSKGISSDDLVVKGYGEKKLINHCVDGVDCGETQHSKNRRAIFWLRDQIGENQQFKKSVSNIVQSEIQQNILAIGRKKGDLQPNIVIPKRENKPEEVIVATKPTIMPSMKPKIVIPKKQDEPTTNNMADAPGIVIPRQRGEQPANNEDTQFGSNALGNQVKVQSETVTKICDVDDNKPLRVQLEELNADIKEANGGISISREPISTIPSGGTLSQPVDVDYNGDKKIITRRGKATLVSRTYTGYKVELFTKENELPNSHEIFRSYGKVFFDDTGVAFSYMIGSFPNKEGAANYLKTVIKPRFPDAKLITYKEGKRK